jgi:hypothetical protein
MAHYAFLDDNNIVTEVIVGVDENELIEGLDPEIWYGNFRNQICKRTSYNNKIRGCFAGRSFIYNSDEDIFISPQPYPSWIRNGSHWESPVERPQSNKMFVYDWDELTQSWVVIYDRSIVANEDN